MARNLTGLDPMNARRFVSIIRSDTDPDRHDVGLRTDVARRLHWHNHGPSSGRTQALVTLGPADV